MIHAGLFSGIGGFSLAARWMGWPTLFEVEKDEWCRKVLHKNFPDALLFEDVCEFDATPFRGRVDILSGGFPCQPWSDAGKKAGTADPRHLWPQFLRIIREVQPAFVVGENVRGLLSWGGGVQFEAVCADLEAEGYTVLPLLLPAVGVGAPHKRDRFWFVAHAAGQRRQKLYAVSGRQESQQPNAGNLRQPVAHANGGRFAAHEPDLREWQSDASGSVAADTHGIWESQPQGRQPELRRWIEHSGKGAAADTVCQRPQAGWGAREAECEGLPLPNQLDGQRPPDGCPADGCGPTARRSIPDFRLTEPPLCSPNDGVPARLVRTGSPRAKQLKAYGNAIVPQVAYQIFQAIHATL